MVDEQIVPNTTAAHLVLAVPGTSPVQIRNVSIVAWSVVDEEARPVTAARLDGTELFGVYDPGLGTVEVDLHSFATLLAFREWAAAQFAAQRSNRADEGYCGR